MERPKEFQEEQSRKVSEEREKDGVQRRGLDSHEEQVSHNLLIAINIKNAANKQLKTFEGGQIKYYLKNWKKLTSDPEIIDIVTGMHNDFEYCPFQAFTPKEIKFSEKRQT